MDGKELERQGCIGKLEGRGRQKGVSVLASAVINGSSFGEIVALIPAACLIRLTMRLTKIGSIWLAGGSAGSAQCVLQAQFLLP